MLYTNRSNIVFAYISNFGKCTYHLGLGYIVSYLQKNDIEAHLYISEADNMTTKDLAVDILKTNPDFIGFTVYDANYHIVSEVIRNIKTISNNVKILVGGPTATFSSEKLLRFVPEIDYCCLYEGEETILELINAIKKGADLSQISGISYRNNDEILLNPPKTLSKSLDKYPSPFLSGVLNPVEMYNEDRVVTLVLSRGCVYNCKYCNYSAVGRHKMRYHSAQYVLDELKYIKEKGLEKGVDLPVQFVDDLFTANRNLVMSLCKLIQKENLKLSFRFHTRPDCLDEELIKELKKSGCTRISLGLENGSASILRDMGKCSYRVDDFNFISENRYIEQTKKIALIIKKYEIELFVNIILGWPSETLEDVTQTFDILEEIQPNRYFPSILTYYAGTEAYKNTVVTITDKIDAIEERTKNPVLNFTYNMFPELYPYNPYDIKHFENNQPQIYKLRSRHILQMLSGVGITPETLVQNLLLENENVRYSWVVKNFPIKTRIGIARKRANEVHIGFPELQFGYDSVNEGLYNIEQCEFFLDLHITEFNQSKTQQYISLNQASDFYKFAEKISLMNNDEIIRAFSINNSLRIIEDFCRWCSGNRCPATNLNQLLVDEYGNLRTCRHGIILGNCNDNFDTTVLLEKIRNLQKQEYAARGCYDCEVFETCPKCLFVSHIGIDFYCQQMKNTQLSKKIKKIRKVQLMDYFFNSQLINE